MKACTVQDIKIGQDMFWYGILPIGVAGRDIPAGSIIDYKPNENTADVILKVEKIISKSPSSHPLSVLDLGKTIIFDPEANKGSVSLESAREPDADPP